MVNIMSKLSKVVYWFTVLAIVYIHMYVHIFVYLKGDSVFNFIIKEGKEEENWRILPEFPLQEKNRKEKLKEVTEKNNNTGLCEMNRAGPLGREYGYNIITLCYHL